MTGQPILIVDDEKSITELVQLYLEREGYACVAVHDGAAALEAVRRDEPALVILDVMLPGVDGFEVCRRLRAENHPVPIIMLTARDDDVDKIVGLELGADDYLTKPFNPRELVARVKAILRRGERFAATAETAPIRIAATEIDPAGRTFRVSGAPVELRAQEFELLLTLVRQRGIVLTREQLLQQAWGYDFYGQTRTVDVHVAHLRRKLAGSGLAVETVTGIGYKLVAEG
ncbi:MAG TPA: response regulator transcription factor [Anaerolineales bacterium]|nr:response regulator transcription factor [Anaerolineales bacterium]